MRMRACVNVSVWVRVCVRRQLVCFIGTRCIEKTHNSCLQHVRHVLSSVGPGTS